MNYTFPHTIESVMGEKIIFQSVEKTPEGEKVLVEAFCEPGCGPIMHTHFKQDEGLTVISGTLGYQFHGQEPQFAKAGESVVFKRGTPHRFWAEGNEKLHCKGWVQPANTVVFFLTALYDARNKSGKEQPDFFDGAYLMTRYSSEYDVPEIPAFVKKVIFPITVSVGKLLGKYKHFKNAPEPVK